tara:strand:+ start:11567 stop:12769 length:1203 start_codon:yes stop_codon:yes gene_type:complete
VLQCDVLIVGAGPAGCAAALTGQKLGLNVVVIDKATFPRDKCCGDGLTTLALRELEKLGVEPTISSWVRVEDVFLRSPAGREVRLTLPSGRGQYAAVVKRIELDAELVRLTANNGVQVHEGVAFDNIELTSRGVQVSLQDGNTVLAKHVVAADGMWSPVRKALGCTPKGYRGDWHAFRQYVKADGRRSRDLWVWFEKDLLPGYAWSFPLADGRVNLGFGVPRSKDVNGKQLSTIWNGLLERTPIREVLGNVEPEDSRTAWPIPARLPKAQLATGPVLFVGDAATATDPMTGEGIGQALESGRLAAQAIAAEGPNESAAAIYERSARTAFQVDHQFSKTLSNVLAKPMLAEVALRAVNANDWSRRNFARWMFEDYPRASLINPRRWRKDLFDTRGAWAVQN